MSLLVPIVSCGVSVAAFSLAAYSASRIRRLKSRTSAQIEAIEKRVTGLQEDLNRLSELSERRQQESLATSSLSGELESLRQQHTQIQHQVEHLRAEEQNLVVLPAWHPVRVSLADELRHQLAPITDQLLPVLFPQQIALDELDWMYRLRDRKFPYSLTFEEGMMMHYLVASNGLKVGYEIATAFGFSSFFIAAAMKKTGGHLISADAYIEEEKEDFIYDYESTKQHVDSIKMLHQQKQFSQLPRGLQFALEGAALIDVKEQVDYRIACSPEGVPELLDGRTLDFAFIDGGHFGEQPVLDVKSVLPYLDSQRFLMMFHDTQCEAVAKAVHFAAESTATKPFSIHTRNRIVAIAKGLDMSTLQTCREMTFRQFV